MKKNAYDKIELCQISLTGVRAIILLGLLLRAPRSLEEIREAFLKCNIMQGSNSDDIIRIDINTLRTMGCEISRADHRTNNKFVLINHPFKIKINKEEVQLLKKAFGEIKESISLNDLIKYTELFEKIADFADDADIKEQLLGISPLKKYVPEMLKDLRFACLHNYTVKLLYKSPVNKNSSVKDIIAQKIVMQNNKLFLFGIDKHSKESISLNIKRILKILFMSETDEDIVNKEIKVKFYLKDFGVLGLDDCETILSGDISEGFVIEGTYHNEFYAKQRMLSFGPNCKVLEPIDFRNKIVELLKKMREVYND